MHCLGVERKRLPPLGADNRCSIALHLGSISRSVAFWIWAMLMFYSGCFW